MSAASYVRALIPKRPGARPLSPASLALIREAGAASPARLGAYRQLCAFPVSDFRAPVPLPSAVTFTASPATDVDAAVTDFVLQASSTGRTHLTGRLTLT